MKGRYNDDTYLIIIDGVIDRYSPSVYSRELKKKLLKILLALFTHWQNKWFVLWLHVKFIDGKKNHWWNDIWFFYRWYVIFIDRSIDEMKWEHVFLRHLSIIKSIYKTIIDEFTDILQITDENFFYELFLFVITLASFLSMNCKYKYR